MRSPESLADESHLVQAAKDDLDCFIPIYEHYAPRIYAFCLRRVGHPQEAEDLTSKVFIQAIASIDTYRGGSVGAWLFQIAANATIDYLRSRHPYVSLDEIDIAGDDMGMIEMLVQREDRQQIRALIACLPQDQQELLALRITAGLSAEDIGLIVGKRPGAIRTALHRVLKQLRRLYQQTEGKDQA